MDSKPICIDLYCGLGGWAEGFLSEGYECIGYDIEAHNYGSGGYPGTLILRDVRSIHGSECKDATCIVASPPCQEPSYRAMPWKRAKALNAAGPPHNFIDLFNQCFRIQREAIEAAGHYIPLVIENVRGAQRWVGRASANYGSYYLWGDVGMVGRRIVAGQLRFGVSVAPVRSTKVPGFRFDGNGGSFKNAAVKTTGRSLSKGAKNKWGTHNMGAGESMMAEIEENQSGCKNDGGSWFGIGGPGQTVTNQNPVTGVKVAGISLSAGKSVGFNVTAAQRYRDGVKQTGISGVRENGKGDKWFQDGAAAHGSRSDSRKAASAMIAKIPFPLAQHIARAFKPA